jgi:plastocyanin
MPVASKRFTTWCSWRRPDCSVAIGLPMTPAWSTGTPWNTTCIDLIRPHLTPNSCCSCDRVRERHLRRLAAGGGLLAGSLLPAVPYADGNDGTVEVHMISDPEGAHVGFDPIGVLIAPGQTVRRLCDANVHSTSAYHPSNDNHSLRIPENAKPWASDFLLPPQIFEVRLTVEGVYDYYCTPHEMAGMVGRIIVGKPGGPGMLPFDYFKVQGRPWMTVPPEAARAFPSIREILREKIVRLRAVS